MTAKKEKKTATEVVLRENEKQREVARTDQGQSYEKMITLAIEKGANIETMERLFALQEKWEANMAKKAFDKAMADFQGECPVIKKLKKGGSTKSGQTAYMYAPLDMIVDQVRAILSKHGLSYTIKTETRQDEKGNTFVKSTCVAKHIAGHAEESSMEVPLGTKTDIMSQSQVVAAAATFSKRYAFVNAFGIMTGDEDNESMLKGSGSGSKIEDTTATVAEVRKLIKEAKLPGINETRFLQYFKADALEQLSLYQLIQIENTVKEKMKPDNSPIKDAEVVKG